MFEFHISRFARRKYSFDRGIYQFNGNVILGDLQAARSFASRMNAQRDLLRNPERVVRPGDVHAMGLIDEILHALAAEYRRHSNPGLLAEALDRLESELGSEEIARLLERFTRLFPPLAVFRENCSVGDYLAGASGDLSHREIALEELVMLSLANDNPAFSRFDELFDETELDRETCYAQAMRLLHAFFKEQPGFGRRGLTLLEMLRLPALRHPESLLAQLEYLLQRFPGLLARFQLRILRGLDLLHEENRPSFQGPGPSLAPEFTAGLGLEESERFSPDRDWMPSLVLLAKNAYVWLDQLSKKYGREIRRLDQIPGDEFQELQSWGFSGLWLIGLWERSPASMTIKHLTGNPDAVASAYSLFDYTIAADLGGELAYGVMRDRARTHGIRLAADMVPNHSGIYSKWMVEHPDWFLYLDYPPFDAYTFEGPDLSQDPRIGIYLEDHYYTRSDAAVVFKRVDRASGRVQYIYHGNDGTSMPWNDTAQLNFLNPDTREAVIRTILEVARKFSVIRFDAAMTLAKKHIQRLWFPEPGQGGAIPSRAGHSLTSARFNELIPREFWREVVDRVAVEAPDTLLLAEAFWLMEGYFVRTLGMHRVYNSAFMNMLRDEKNAGYRSVIKKTIEFDPQILKRYVNFMNNPDEDTAVEQFGKGGKYFGVCVVMATMPGLPMFGHGQVEGLAEKYGMEYQRAYYDEVPDSDLVERHRREIFPLLLQRRLFAGVENFLLYDFHTAGGVNEDVFAYSNRSEGQASLVVYHNKWAETGGTIRLSAAYAARKAGGSTDLVRRALAEGLGLPEDPAQYVIFQDAISGLEYIRSCAEMHAGGLQFDLGAYEYRVFLNFRVVHDNEWSHYRLITDYLGGRGVVDLESVKQEVVLQPVLVPWRELVNPGFFEWMIDLLKLENAGPGSAAVEEIKAQVEAKYSRLAAAIGDFTGLSCDHAGIAARVAAQIERLSAFEDLSRSGWSVLLTWVFAHMAGLAGGDDAGYPARSRAWLDEWMFGRVIHDLLAYFEAGDRAPGLVALLAGRRAGSWLRESAIDTIKAWLQDGETSRFLGVNRHNGILWYDRQALYQLLDWARILAKLEDSGLPTTAIDAYLDEIREAGEIAGFQVQPMLDLLGQAQTGTGSPEVVIPSSEE